MLTKKMSMLNFESPANSIQLGARGASTRSEDSKDHYYLEQLPQELYVHILSMLSLSDVGNLSLTGSTRIRTKIIDWIMSKSFQRKISVSLAVPVSSLTTADGLDCWKKVTKEFGMLVKKVSMIYGTSYRLRLLSAWYGSLDSLVRPEDGLWAKFLSRTGLACALAALTLGWDVVEFNKILGWLRESKEDFTGDGRRLLRLYLWQHLATEQCKGTWLSWLLQTLTGSQQPGCQSSREEANLLMCLFGPATFQPEANSLVELGELTNFQELLLVKMQGRPNYLGLLGFRSRSYQYAKWRFEDIGKALSCLLRSRRMSHGHVQSILDALFGQFIVGADNQGKFQ